ncbi:glycosyltransferase family 9 protein [Deferribacter abyssi]|uniref:glycosyltransferase family 9 protein n=1 Tax=Deferribacter abyssi TaxID=213806 RepID=UPI003C1A71EE
MKILIIQLYQIGDVILTTPIPREIKKVYPNATIHFLTTDMCYDIIKNNIYIDNILTITRTKNLLYMINTIKEIRWQKYDYILDFQNNPRTMWINLFSNSPNRITYHYTKRKLAYNKFAYPNKTYAVDIKFSLLKYLDINNYNNKPEIFITDKEIKTVTDYLKQNNIENYITISPTHKKETRRWPLKYFIQLAQYVYEHLNLKVIFTYAPNEYDYVKEIQKHSYFNKAFFFTPKINLLELAAFIKLAKFHVGNDSAPNHMAVAMNTPSFIVLGSTSEGWTYPSKTHAWVRKNLECQPCKKSKCKFGNSIPCLNNLTVDEIKPKFESFIEEVINV